MRTALFLVCLLSEFALAQNCTQTVPVNVLDQKTGMAMTSLQPSVFQARMGEAALPITGLQRVEHRRVLVLVDASASMAPKDGVGTFQKEALDAVEETLAELLEKLPVGTPVAYGLFNDTSVFTPEFLADTAKLRDAIAEAKKQLGRPGKGETSLFDALHQAMLRFGTPQPGDTIVVLTDTGENKSKMHPGTVEKELRRSGLRLALLLVQQHTPFELTPYWDVLTSLAEDSGGPIGTIDVADRSWLNRKDSAANREALRKFWTQEVLGGYLMQVQTPATLMKPRKWNVRINAANNADLKRVTIQYPTKLGPCSVSTAAVH
jgi:hypothetical protein